MKRKQIALLLSLVLSVSPMAEGAVVWGADFTDGTAIEQTQQEETTEEVSDFDSEETVFSAGKEQNMEAAAFSDENIETGESRYEVGLNYDTGTADLLPGHTVTVSVDLYWIHTDEDGNERRDNYEGNYQIKLKGDLETLYENSFVSAKVSEDGRSLIITAKGKDELDPNKDNFGDIPISIFVDGEEVAEEGVYISVRDSYHIIKMDDKLESGEVIVDLGDELDLSSYGIKTSYYDAENTEGTEDPDVYYEVEHDENIWEETGKKDNGLPVLKRKGNLPSKFRIHAWKQNKETGEKWKVSETQFWIYDIDYNSDLNFSYGSRSEDVFLYGENVKPLTLTVVPAEESDSNLKGFTVDWKVEQYVDNNDEENMIPADCVEYSTGSSGSGIINDTITLSAKKGYDFTNKNLRLSITATVSKEGKEVTRTGTALWVNEAVEDINFPGSETLLPGWGMNINPVYYGWQRDEKNPWGTEIYAHVTDVKAEGPDGVLTVSPDEDGYHLQAARNGKTGEFEVTLCYYTSKSEEGEEGKKADKTYTFHVSVKDEKYYSEYHYSSTTSGSFGIILPNTETVVTTSLYNQQYDIEQDGQNQTEIKDYQLKLAEKKEGTPAWDTNLVSVTVDGHKLMIKANNKTGDTEIPVEFVVNGETVLTENIHIGVEENICYISPDELTDKDGNRLNVNVGERLDLGNCGIQTHQLTVTDGENKDEILDTTLGKDEFRYRVEYNQDAWKSSLPEGQSGLPVLTRTAFYETSVKVIAERKLQNEEGESDWEEVNQAYYWFDDVHYDMDFKYSYGDRNNARIYTDKDLTLTLQTEPELDLSNKIFNVDWKVYRYNEEGEEVDASDLVTIKKSGTTAVLKANADHSADYFQVKAVVTVDGKMIAQCDNEIRIQDSVYSLTGNPEYRRILKGEYLRYNKDDSGKIRMVLYEEDGSCPEGKTTEVQVTDIKLSESGIFEKVEKDDRTEIHAVKPGIVEVTFSLEDKDGKKLKPVTVTLEAVDSFTWMENSLTGNSDTGEILPGESTKIETRVMRLSADKDGKREETTLTAGKDYKLEYYGYDTDLISIKEDGTVTANPEERGYTWIGIRAISPDDPEKVITDSGIDISVSGRYYVIEPKNQEELYLQSDGKEEKINLQAIVYGIKNPSGRLDTEGKFEIDEEDFKNGDLNVAIKKDNTLVISVRSDASVLEPGAAFWYDIPVRYVKNGERVATKVYTVVRCNHIAKETGRVWPSCGSSGYVNYRCETCGYTWQETLGAYGHSWNSGVVTKEPTCGTDGIKTYTCTDCGSTYTEIVKAAGEHKWDEGAVTKKATCTEDGVKTYTCTVCKETKTEIIPALKHKWGAWKTKSAATVFKAKVQERTCTTCKKTQTRTKGEKLTPKATQNVKSLKLKKKQKTTAFKITGMAKGDYVKSWKSSNPNIAKVSGKKDGTCTITAQKQTGTVRITITFASGMVKTLEVKVQASTVKTTAINIIAKKATLKKGKTLKLKPVLEPITSGEKITYESSDPEIAKVSKTGVVTGLKPGTVTITIRSGKRTVTCKITVKK